MIDRSEFIARHLSSSSLENTSDALGNAKTAYHLLTEDDEYVRDELMNVLDVLKHFHGYTSASLRPAVECIEEHLKVHHNGGKS